MRNYYRAHIFNGTLRSAIFSAKTQAFLVKTTTTFLITIVVCLKSTCASWLSALGSVSAIRFPHFLSCLMRKIEFVHP